MDRKNSPWVLTLWFVFRTVLIVLLLVCSLWFSYYIAKQSANVYIITFEGMTDRADMILSASKLQNEYDLSSFFTEQALQEDSLLINEPYKIYDVTNYDYAVHIEAVYAWPWSRTATVRIREIVSRIDGKVLDSIKTENPDIPVAPPQWTPYAYNVKLAKFGEKWLIYGLEVIEEISAVTPVLTPSVTPTPQQTPSESA